MSASRADERLVVADVHRVDVAPDGASAQLATASRTLVEGRAGEVGEVGVWEAGPGRDTDVEVDELFLVLSGAGRVVFDDDSHIDLVPGVLVQLRAGDRTTWVVTERLRKLYLV